MVGCHSKRWLNRQQVQPKMLQEVTQTKIAEHKTKVPHIRGITPEGKIYNFARNAKNASEFAGSCFSPDGSVMFVNMQGLGYTLAITGPWQNRV